MGHTVWGVGRVTDLGVQNKGVHRLVVRAFMTSSMKAGQSVLQNLI